MIRFERHLRTAALVHHCLNVREKRHTSIRPHGMNSKVSENESHMTGVGCMRAAELMAATALAEDVCLCLEHMCCLRVHCCAPCCHVLAAAAAKDADAAQNVLSVSLLLVRSVAQVGPGLEHTSACCAPTAALPCAHCRRRQEPEGIAGQGRRSSHNKHDQCCMFRLYTLPHKFAKA